MGWIIPICDGLGKRHETIGETGDAPFPTMIDMNQIGAWNPLSFGGEQASFNVSPNVACPYLMPVGPTGGGTSNIAAPALAAQVPLQLAQPGHQPMLAMQQHMMDVETMRCAQSALALSPAVANVDPSGRMLPRSESNSEQLSAMYNLAAMTGRGGVQMSGCQCQGSRVTTDSSLMYSVEVCTVGK